MADATQPPPTRFVILCLGRTGSTHLQSMLDFHSQARCYGEIFGDGKPPTFAASDDPDPAAFLARMLAEGLADDERRAVGLKLPINSIRLTPAAAEIARADDQLAVIRLSRRNRLAQLVSRQLLATTGVSQSIFGSYGETTIRLEPEACLPALERIEAEERELDALCAGHETFPIAYEELADEGRLVELQRFLGLDPEPLRSWFERLRTRPLAQTVSNWGEIVSAPSGTRYEGLLNDDA